MFCLRRSDCYFWNVVKPCKDTGAFGLLLLFVCSAEREAPGFGLFHYIAEQCAAGRLHESVLSFASASITFLWPTVFTFAFHPLLVGLRFLFNERR